MKSQTCCFSGHRVISAMEYPKMQKRIEEEVVKLIHQGVRYFGVGGAIGFDTAAALTIIGLRPEYSDIRLILVLPCKNQTKDWEEKDIKIYNSIYGKADKVVYTSLHYDSGCMHRRNRHLIDNSSVCICYLTKEGGGGTACTVRYARKSGLRVINLARA